MRGDTATLLVADDTDSVRHVVVKLLEAAGYRVLAARNGEEAVRIVRERGEHIDLALLDMAMPKLTGPEAYERMKEQHGELKVLFTSGYGEALPGGKRISSSRMLRKPYPPDELLRRVAEALDSRQSATGPQGLSGGGG